MNLNSETNKVIVKYALLLAILYAVQLSVSYLMTFLYLKPANNVESLLKSWIPLLVVIIGNIITMLFVIKDKRRFQIKNKYLTWLTFFFCPVGVCILLIQIMLETRGASVGVNQSEEQ